MRVLRILVFDIRAWFFRIILFIKLFIRPEFRRIFIMKCFKWIRRHLLFQLMLCRWNKFLVCVVFHLMHWPWPSSTLRIWWFFERYSIFSWNLWLVILIIVRFQFSVEIYKSGYRTSLWLTIRRFFSSKWLFLFLLRSLPMILTRLSIRFHEDEFLEFSN